MQRDALIMYHKFDKSYINKPLLLALGGCFEKKKANKWGIINK